jgi:hypothetical protein
MWLDIGKRTEGVEKSKRKIERIVEEGRQGKD